MDEFAEALDLADSVYLCDIFGSARESRGDVKIEDLGNKIQKGWTEVIKERMCHHYWSSRCCDHFMGAGDVQSLNISYALLSNTTRNVL